MGRLPTRFLAKRCRSRQSTVTVRRPSESKGDLGEIQRTYTDKQRDIALFSPSHSLVQTTMGEQERGGLRGMILPSVDVQVDDRLDYGGNTYEVETITGVPGDDNPVVKELVLVRVEE